MTRRLDLTATLTTTGTVTPPIGPIPPDTAAALESAIEQFVCVVRADSGSHAEFSSAVAARDGLDRAITAHVEAEVARRMAAAPDVDAAIDRLDMYADPYRADALRAAIAADKARAVEAEATRREAEIFGLRARLAIVAEIAEEAISSASEAPDCHEQVQDYRERMRKWRTSKPARPTPDEARRLVAEYTEGIIDYTLSGTTVVAAGHGTAVTGTIGPDPRITSIATARTALLRALGVES